MANKVNLNGKLVGEGEPVYIIAEGGLTNWGDLGLAKKQVDIAMAAGADAIKFQAQTTEELVSKKVDPNWYKRLKYKELSHDDLRKLWEYCQIRDIECFITSHTDTDLDFLDKELKVPFFKIGSGESLNFNFLENVGSRKKPVILSLGLHLNDDEIKKSILTLEKAGTRDIVLMHCISKYPAPPEIVNLKTVNRLLDLTDYPIGYSDHTVGWHIPLAAVAIGASVIEKHLSFDKKDKRSFDCAVSCEPTELNDMVDQIRDIEKALADSRKGRNDHVLNSRKWAMQSIVASTYIAKGTKLAKKHILFKRPGLGLQPEEMDDVVGKRTVRDLYADELILQEDLI